MLWQEDGHFCRKSWLYPTLLSMISGAIDVPGYVDFIKKKDVLEGKNTKELFPIL